MTDPKQIAELSGLLAEVEAGNFDQLEVVADRWSESAGVQRMANAIASVFERHAPQDIMDRFREKLSALMHLSFVEGAAQGVMQFPALLDTAERVQGLEAIARDVVSFSGDSEAWGDFASLTSAAGKFAPITNRARALLAEPADGEGA